MGIFCNSVTTVEAVARILEAGSCTLEVSTQSHAQAHGAFNFINHEDLDKEI